MSPHKSNTIGSTQPGRRRAHHTARRAALVVGIAFLLARATVAHAERLGCETAADCGVDNACASFSCIDGHCRRESPNCDDGNPCTGDFCDASIGCLHTLLELDFPCPDDNVCNGEEKCDGEGTCLAGTPLAAGTSCSDGNVCNGDETCDGAGSCAAGEALNCDDGHACTTDTCDPEAGCQNAVRPTGAVCREAANSICDLEESCDGTSLDCPADSHEPDGIQCDDGNPATIGETCHAGMCSCSGADLDGDQIPDSCDPADATIVVKRAVAWPMRDKPAHIKAHGTLKTGVYGAADVLDPSGGFTVRVTDGLTMDVSSSVAGSLCKKSRIGTIDCRDDERIRLVFLPTRRVPGQYRWSLYLRNLDFMKPQAGPLTVTITDSHMIDRVGTAPMCRNAETGLPCR